jgi:hypothetical protein
MAAPPLFRSPRIRRDLPVMLQPMEVRMIMIAGSDLASTEAAALPLFRAGHVPVIGEWLAEPLAALSGVDAADEDAGQLMEPLTERLLARCDAVLRVGGPSPAADAVVGLARARGLRVFFSLKECLDA